MARTEEYETDSEASNFGSCASDPPPSEDAMSPVRCRYESDEEEQVEPQRPKMSLQASRKSAPWKPTRYRYPDSEEDGAVTRKRRNSDQGSLGSTKRLRSTGVRTIDDFANLEDENEVLRAHIEELYDFIQDAGVLLKAPQSIRDRLDDRPNGAAVFARALRAKIDTATGHLSDESGRYINGDDWSEAVVPFIKDIRTLARFPQPDSLDLAIKTVLYLADSSFGELDVKGGCGYGDRPSDVQADDLFCYLARKKRRVNPEWDFKPILTAFMIKRKDLAGYGIDDHFVDATAMMQQWEKASETPGQT